MQNVTVCKQVFFQTNLFTPEKKNENNNSHKIHVLYHFATIYHSNILTFILFTPIDHNLLNINNHKTPKYKKKERKKEKKVYPKLKKIY